VKEEAFQKQMARREEIRALLDAGDDLAIAAE
jgi:hypothetical protein